MKANFNFNLNNKEYIIKYLNEEKKEVKLVNNLIVII